MVELSANGDLCRLKRLSNLLFAAALPVSLLLIGSVAPSLPRRDAPVRIGPIFTVRDADDSAVSGCPDGCAFYRY
jgi:hypothetical protein